MYNYATHTIWAAIKEGTVTDKQTSVSGCWYRLVDNPACRSVCPEGCTVAKRLIGSGCRLGVVSVVGRGMGALDGVEIVEGKGQFWG